MVPGLVKLSYEECLRRKDLPSLEYGREGGAAIEAFKSLYEKYAVDASTILSRHESGGMMTRGHSLKPQKRECHRLTLDRTFSDNVLSTPGSHCRRILGQ